MPGVFEFVDVGPDFGLPPFFMRGRLAARGTASMQGDRGNLGPNRRGPGKFHEDAADLLDLFVCAQQMLVAEQVAEA